jgi:hypothetical protein
MNGESQISHFLLRGQGAGGLDEVLELRNLMRPCHGLLSGKLINLQGFSFLTTS